MSAGTGRAANRAHPSGASERRVAVVMGASRGARGIASLLGERGYVVYVTGRTTRGHPPADGMPGTVEDTAEEVTRRGGVGVPVRVDHRVDAEVEALVERVRAEQGRLDLLVNNAWGGYENDASSAYLKRFWELPTIYWQSFFENGVRMHFVTSRHVLPLMLQRAGRGTGLAVSTVAWDHDKYLGSWYDVAKHAIVRFIHGLTIELRGLDVAAVAVAPGFMCTDAPRLTPEQ